MIGVDHHILEQDHKAPTRGGDREKQVHHAKDPILVANHKNATAARLLKDQPQAPLLQRAVRRKIARAGKQLHHQLGQRRQVLDRRRLNPRRILDLTIFSHCHVRAHKRFHAHFCPKGTHFPTAPAPASISARPEIGPHDPCPPLGLLLLPLADPLVMTGNQHLRHLHPTKIQGLGVARRLQQIRL